MLAFVRAFGLYIEPVMARCTAPPTPNRDRAIKVLPDVWLTDLATGALISASGGEGRYAQPVWSAT